MTKKTVKNAAATPELADRLVLFEAWLYRNWIKLAAVAAAVVVIVAIYYIAAAVGASQERAAADAVARAGADQAKLAAAVTAHAKAQAVNPARMRLAMNAINDQRYQDALTFLDEIDAMSNSPELVSQSMLLAAATQEKAGQIDDAVARYRKIATDPEVMAARRAEAAYQAGRLLVAQGKTAEARASLEEAAAHDGAQNQMDYSAGVYARLARSLLLTLPVTAQ